MHCFLQTFRGVVFYQGESNSVRGGNAQAAEYYGCAVRALIDDWRRRFPNGHDLAFHQVRMREKHYNCRLFGAVQCSAVRSALIRNDELICPDRLRTDARETETKRPVLTLRFYNYLLCVCIRTTMCIYYIIYIRRCSHRSILSGALLGYGLVSRLSLATMALEMETEMERSSSHRLETQEWCGNDKSHSSLIITFL